MSTHSFCPNCYHPDPGEYCPQCGQKQAERRVSLRSLATEFLDEQFGVNRRLPRTLRTLLFKPGFLTTEYFEGRVQQYIPPLRLYLVTSLFFFALFLAAGSNSITINSASADIREELAADTALQNRVRPREEGGEMIRVQVDADSTNWLEDADVKLGWAPLDAAVERRLKEFAVFGEVEGTRRLIRAVIAEMPKVFFLLLPVYAFLLWLFFRRQRRFYVEHFIMGLHLHSFGFLAMLPMPLFDFGFLPARVRGFGELLSPFILLWIFIYIFLALRRVYGQGRFMTALKYFCLWILYVSFFGFGVMLSGVLALMS
jgi:hypothetical protein